MCAIARLLLEEYSLGGSSFIPRADLQTIKMKPQFLQKIHLFGPVPCIRKYEWIIRGNARFAEWI